MENERPPTILEKARQLIHFLEDGILVTLSLSLIGLAVAQIVLRNFQSSYASTEVLIRILVLWIGLLGAMAATRSGNHINIDLVSRFLPEKSRIGKGIVVEIFTAVVCCVVALNCFRFVREEYTGGMTAFVIGPIGNLIPMTKVPMWLCESIMPIAFAVIGLRYIISVLVNFRRFVNYP